MNSFFSVLKYLRSFNSIENSTIKNIAIDKNEYRSVGVETGKFLSFLVRLTQAKRVLEIGTCIGYSSIWIGEALKATGGKLVTIEYNPKYFEEAKKNIAYAGLGDYIYPVLGDAEVVIKGMNDESFDLVLQDCEKKLYSDMLDDCIRITKKNGIIVVDDALLKAFGMDKALVEPIHNFNERVFPDKRLYSIMLPIGNGLTISIKM